MSAKKKKRRDNIINIVMERGAVTVGELAEMLDVSMQTIRRDIDKMCDGNTLRRRHGRVEVSEKHLKAAPDLLSTDNLPFQLKFESYTANIIPDGATIFLCGGPLIATVAHSFAHHKNLTVITNNLYAAAILCGVPTNRVIVQGGEVQLPNGIILGDASPPVFDQYRAAFGVFSVTGIAEDGLLVEHSIAEARAQEAAIRNSQVSVLIAQKSQFGHLAPAAGAQLHDVDLVLLDDLPNSTFAGLIDSLGDRLIARGNPPDAKDLKTHVDAGFRLS